MTEEPVSSNTPPPATPQQPAPESSSLGGAVNGGTLEVAQAPVASPVTPAPAAPSYTRAPADAPAPASPTPTPTTTTPDAEQPVSSYAQTVTQQPLDDTLEVQNEGVTHYPKQASVNAASLKAVGFSRRKALLVSVLITLLSMLILTGALFAFARLGQSNKGDNSPVAGVPTQQLDLGQSNQSQLDLANRTVALVVNGNVAVKGNLQIDSGGHTVKIQAAGIATDQLVTLPNASGTICLSSNNCGYLTPSDLAAVNDKFGQITFPTIPTTVASLNSQTGNILLQGTTNQITLTTNGTTITLATPQDLNTTAAVQFGDITTDTLTGSTVTTTTLLATSLTTSSLSATTASVGTIQQLAAGTDITINSGSDEIIFVMGGTTFKFPGGGPSSQVICTTGVTCASGGGQAVLLAPTSVQVDNTADPSIFINDTGGGNLLQLQTSGVDKLVVANNGDVTVSGNLRATSFGSSSQSLSLLGNSSSSLVVGSAGNTTTLNFAAPSGANTLTFPAATGTVCVSGVACSPTGSAGGDLTGSYPNPTIAKLQGTAVNVSGLASGQFLTYNGTNWLNQGFSGDIGVNGAGLATIQPDAVALGTDTTGNYVASIGTLTGLSAGSNTGEGSTPSLSVLYGATANTAVQGNTSLTCPSGTGNLTGGGNSITLGTGGSCNNLSTNNAVTFSTSVTTALLQSSGTMSITPGGALTVGATTQSLLLQGSTTTITSQSNSHTVTVGFSGSASGNLTYNFDNTASPNTYTICSTAGNCAGVGGGVTTTGGTSNRLAKFTAAQGIGDSQITDNGTTVSITGNLQIQGSNALSLGTASTNRGSLVLYNASNANTVTIRSGVSGGNLTFTLPIADGSDGQCLSTDGSGNLAFVGCLTSSGTTAGVASLNGLTGALTVANASASSSTITLDNASTSSKGIAQFNSTNFSVASGVVNTIQNINSTATPTFAGLTVGTLNGVVRATSGVLSTGSVNAASEISGLLPAANGGTGVNGSAAASGNLLIGNGSGFTIAPLTAGNGVSVTNGAGSITLATLYGATANTAVQGNTVLVCPSGTGNLSGGGDSITLGTGGSCSSLTTVSSPTFTSATLQGSTSLTLGTASSATGSIVFKTSAGANNTTLVGPASTGTNTLTLPNESGTLCSTGSVCSGYAASASLNGYVQFAPAVVQADSSTNNSIFINKTGVSGNILQVQKSASDVFVIANNGAVTASNGVTVSSGGLSVTGTTSINTSGSAATTIGNNGSGGILSLQSATSVNLDQNTVLAAGKSLTVTGGNTASRPGSPSEGMVYFDTTTKQLLTYANGKWQADRSTATKIVAASNSSQATKDAADYVADGTGDQVEINAALTAASGGKVYLAEGTYVANATILIPNNTTLVGAGPGTSIELADLDATDNLVENSDTSTGTGVVIRDLTLNGRNDLNTAGTQNGIYFNGMGSASSNRTGARMENLTLKNFRDVGISLDTSYLNDITGSSFTNMGGAVLLSSADSNRIRGNTIQNMSSTSNALISLSTSKNNTVSGNTLNGRGSGVSAAGNSSYGNVIDSNSFSSNTKAVYFDGAQRNTISNNTITGSTTAGIYLDNTLGPPPNYNVVSGNNIYDSGGATTNEGIIISNGSYNSVVNNMITDSACTTNCYAIDIMSGSSKNSLQGNRFTGSAANVASINDAGTNTAYANQQVNTTTSGNSDISAFRFRGSANDAAAFAVQNASGTDVLSVNTSTPGVTITGTLSVSGTASLNGNTTIGDATTDRLTVTSQLLGQDALVFQGASDDSFTTTFRVTDPTANNVITFPNSSGTVQLAPTSGSYLQQVPASTAANTVTPTANSVVGLTVNGTSGTAATALSVVQTGNATGLSVSNSGTGDGQTVAITGTSGTVTNGLSLSKSGAGGTVTNLLNLSRASGTATNAINISGTFTNLINSNNFTVTNAGAVTAVGVDAGSGLLQGAGGLTLTGATNVNTSGSSAINVGTGTYSGAIAIGNASSTTTLGGAITATNTMTIQGSNALTLGLANSVTGAILFKDSTSSFTGTLVVGGLSQDRTFTLPSQGGTICTDSGNCAGAGTTLQSAYNNSGGGITPEITLNNGGNTGGVDVQNSFSSPVVGSLFAVRDGASSGLGNALFGVSNTGATTIQSSSSAAFLIQSNDAVQQTLFKVDGSGNASNLITNPSFEAGTTGWAARGSASGLAQTGSKYLYGTKSLTANTTTSGDGVVYTIPSTLSASTSYNFSVYVQRATSSSTNMQLYFSYNGASGNDTACTSSSQNIQSTGWNRLSCSFTTGSGGTAPTSSNTVAIKQTSSTSMTMYYDGAQLIATSNSNPPPYYEATYTFNGYVNSSLVMQPVNDSVNAFQVLSASGVTNVLNVDTLNNRVTIGSGNINPGSSAARLVVTGSLTNSPIVQFTQSADSSGGPGFSAGNILTLSTSSTGTTNTVASFGQGYYNDSSGSGTFAALTPTFNPTASSTASYTGLSVAPIVNFQAGGAGSFAAVSINPTYTAAPSGTNSSLKVNTSLSTAIGIIIQGAASQSADMIQFQDSGGTKLLGLVPVTGGTAFTDSSSQQLLKFNTTDNILKVGDSTGTDTAVTIFQVDSTSAVPTTSLSSRNGGLYYNSNLGKLQFIEGNTAKTFCNTSDLGCGNEGSVTLQSAYNNSSSPALITTTAGAKTITFAAGATFDSATLFTIQNAAGTNLFVVDSLNNTGAIKIGGGDTSADGSPVLLVLDNKSTTGDPTGLEGAMYYNAASKLFRCYSDGTWQSCSALEIDKRFEVNDEFIGGAPSSSNQIGTLGWSVVNGSCTAATSGYSVSPGMLPSGDHPGVFYTTQPASAASYNLNTYRLGPAATSGAGWIIQPNNVVKAAVAIDSTSVNTWMKVGILTQASGTCTGTFYPPSNVSPVPNPADPTVGVWWEAAPGSNANWRYCYGTGSAAVCAASGVAVAANTWARVEIRVNSTSSVTFLINGNSYTVTGITLNTSTATYPSFACLTGENTARTCSIDYYQARGVASSQR